MNNAIHLYNNALSATLDAILLHAQKLSGYVIATKISSKETFFLLELLIKNNEGQIIERVNLASALQKKVLDLEALGVDCLKKLERILPPYYVFEYLEKEKRGIND